MKKENNYGKLELIATIFIVAALAYSAQYALSQTGEAANYRNVTVATTVNITNSIPEIISITIDPDTLTLNAGGTQTLDVNFTVRDFDGYQDINNTNVVFFDANVNVSSDPDDNNAHYTNGSCEFLSGSGNEANYSCGFDIWYYANNGTQWTANISVNDSFNFNATNLSTSTIESLLALNVTDVIDFGNLAVGETNDPSIEANITNFGNVQINVTAYGYGNVTGDGLAMVCEQRNISIDNERFDVNSATGWAAMNQLSSTAQHIPGLNLVQRTNDTTGGEVINQTYWRIRVPASTNPAGRCNGTIIFQAELP